MTLSNATLYLMMRYCELVILSMLLTLCTAGGIAVIVTAFKCGVHVATAVIGVTGDLLCVISAVVILRYTTLNLIRIAND